MSRQLRHNKHTRITESGVETTSETARVHRQPFKTRKRKMWDLQEKCEYVRCLQFSFSENMNLLQWLSRNMA